MKLWRDCPYRVRILSSLVFIKGYETRLKDSNPTVRNLTYDSRDLLTYIDTLPDLGILTYPEARELWIPRRLTRRIRV